MTTRTQKLVDEVRFWSFYLPREAVQAIARRVPLTKLRDRLPRALTERLRLGLYPARISDPLEVVCARKHAAWGTPAELDPRRCVRYAEPPRASILVVTYGNLELTRLCLASLQRAAGPLPFEVIVVDNNSTDDTLTYLRSVEESRLLPLRVIANLKNRGFAAANNQAARVARGDTLVFLNNDTVVRAGWLERLCGALDSDRSVGLVGPATNSCGNEAEVGTRYRDLDEMERFAQGYTATHQGEHVEPAMLTLFCAAIPRSLFRAIGGLDERYGRGMFEDDDLGMAVQAQGKRLLLLRDVFVHHYGGAAFSKLPPRDYLRLFHQNRLAFERKWHTRWQER